MYFVPFAVLGSLVIYSIGLGIFFGVVGYEIYHFLICFYYCSYLNHFC